MEKDIYFNKSGTELSNIPTSKGFYDYMQNKVEKDLEQYRIERLIQMQKMERERQVRLASQQENQ